MREAPSLTHSPLPIPFPSRLACAARGSALHLAGALHRNPAVALFLAVFVIARVILGLQANMRLATGLRSTLMGLALQGVFVLCVDTLHRLRFGRLRDLTRLTAAEHGQIRARASLALLLGTWALWALMIVDGLQRAGDLPGAPLLGGLPGYAALLCDFASLGEGLHAVLPALSAEGYAGRLLNLALRLLLPMGGLLLLGWRWSGLRLSFRNGLLLAPFYLILSGMAAANGLSGQRLVFAGATLLHPGLTEEFLYRGPLLRLLSVWQKPATRVLLTALLFAALHFPSYYAQVYDGSLPLALLNLLDTALTGLAWGYAALRLGSVLPLALLHGLVDLG